MRRGVFLKLFALCFLVIATATITLDLTIRPAWESSLQREIEQAMVEKTRLFAYHAQATPPGSLQQFVSAEAAAANVRATVVDAKGQVLADSQAAPETMENHADRQEIASALKGQIGLATRWSHTVSTPFLYVAAPIPTGAVRMAYPLSSVMQTKARVRRGLLLSSVIALLVSMILAAVLAQLVARRLRRIVAFAERIASGDLSARIDERSIDEISTVATALDRTARMLEDSFRTIETSRKQLETLLNSMQEAVIAVGADGKVLWVNGQMQKLAGAGVRVGAPVVQTVRDPNFLAAVQEALDARKTCVGKATALRPGRAFQITAAPMPPSGAVAVLRDISEVERVEKTRRDFIANVSHELRTPLTSVQGYAETLLDSPAAENANTREFLEIIVKNAARMSLLTEDLLVLARVESREQRFDMRPVRTGDLLNDVVETFEITARDAGIELIAETSGDEQVMADREAVHQVMSNLIRNAINYARDGGRIVVGTRRLENAVEFYVRDFGQGIPSEHLPRLFERFYRVDKTRSRESGGTGLGLAIVKHIVLAHEGEIRAESQLGHGSTFYFSIPLAETGSSAAADRG